ncbi:transmembrane protein, putative [Medicago truncatula]|uniref:Transmembrane protein, putative n=1 Tax=Medicago truncatula TaxID=3880 RepID=G7LIH9_MEDTR|nr:transmembrane protein, putative [Medicago truncatula]
MTRIMKVKSLKLYLSTFKITIENLLAHEDLNDNERIIFNLSRTPIDAETVYNVLKNFVWLYITLVQRGAKEAYRRGRKFRIFQVIEDSTNWKNDTYSKVKGPERIGHVSCLDTLHLNTLNATNSLQVIIIFPVISLIAISLTINYFWSIQRFIDGEEEDEDDLILVGHERKKEYA